jgi:hypothetical protein
MEQSLKDGIQGLTIKEDKTELVVKTWFRTSIMKKFNFPMPDLFHGLLIPLIS